MSCLQASQPVAGQKQFRGSGFSGVFGGLDGWNEDTTVQRSLLWGQLQFLRHLGQDFYRVRPIHKHTFFYVTYSMCADYRKTPVSKGVLLKQNVYAVEQKANISTSYWCLEGTNLQHVSGLSWPEMITSQSYKCKLTVRAFFFFFLTRVK